MRVDKISIKLLKAERSKISDELDALTKKTDELQAQVDENQIKIVGMTAEKQQLKEDIDKLKNGA